MTDTEAVTTVPTETSNTFERDTSTGYVKGVTYARRPDGRIDWRRHIKPEHIVFNRRFDSKLLELYGATADKLVYSDVIQENEVADEHVLVLLQGFVELADFRGYSNATSRLTPVSHEMVCATATIDWVSNEEEPHGKTSTGEADATMDNTGGFGYLSAIAGNRAFVRAVRRGLRIPILGFDEIAKKDTALPESAQSASAVAAASAPATLTPAGTLQRAAEEETTTKRKYTFEQVKAGAMAHWEARVKDPAYEPVIENDPAPWAKWEDVPPRDCLTLTKLIKKKAKEAAAKTKAKKAATA